MAAGDAATPLLVLETTYQYHEGCPACAVERSKAVNPGIPYMRFFHIWIIILVSSNGRALAFTHPHAISLL
ncbi:hypothetical protein OsI_35002 [Oryza sativa Indica Group]|uniref:Uncharacterized protein n=1 Tax=Oryza sativa subsp. indica TaxID=39946 RepID=B8BIY6_ORYSI|nr:hypothetical protein OsI_35002 [Oryza sativa Indica Group]